MQRIRKLLICIIFSFILILLSGCFIKKNVISSDQFASIMQEHKFSITDATDQYSNFAYVSSVQVATSKDFQIEFYILDSEENAMKMYTRNKSNFEKEKTSSALTTDSSVNNYSSFSITDNTMYRYICRVENTLIYVNTTKESKDKVKEIIASLGY